MNIPSGQRRAAAPPPPVVGPVTVRTRGRPVVRYVLAGLCTVVVALAAVPDLLFDLDRVNPFAELVAVRPVMLAGLVMVIAVLVVGRFRRRALPFTAGALVVLLAGLVMLVPRAVAGAVPTGGRALTVLVFNTFDGAADVEALASFIRTEHPDLVSLPEAGADFRSRLGPLVEPAGYRLTSSTGPGTANVDSVTAVVADGLGDVRTRIGQEMTVPYVEVTGGQLGALRFVAVHPDAPVAGKISYWRSDLARLGQWCAGPTPAVVAGDFNATLDHSPLRRGMAGCGDAAAQRGEGLTPTWGPTPRTRLIGPQIDHVLATTPITTETFTVIDLPGSDHRAILTRLRLPA